MCKYSSVYLACGIHNTWQHMYTLYAQGVSLNDGIISIKVENVNGTSLEASCVLILNTLHMYWMPLYVCKDEIIDDDDKTVEFISDSFNIRNWPTNKHECCSDTGRHTTCMTTGMNLTEFNTI